MKRTASSVLFLTMIGGCLSFNKAPQLASDQADPTNQQEMPRLTQNDGQPSTSPSALYRRGAACEAGPQHHRALPPISGENGLPPEAHSVTRTAAFHNGPGQVPADAYPPFPSIPSHSAVAEPTAATNLTRNPRQASKEARNTASAYPLPQIINTPLPKPTKPTAANNTEPVAPTTEMEPEEVQQAGHFRDAPPPPSLMIADQESREVVQAADEEQPGTSPMQVLVNSKRITLNFEVKDVGPSGVAGVELWSTKDGKDWRKQDASSQARAYVIEVDEEGRYGFTLVARNGMGLGQQPPRSGDLPQVWVVVDLSKPQVHVDEVKTVVGGQSNEVAIHWTAQDQNLGEQPIRLCYAEEEDGPWLPIAENLGNTGTYTWSVTPDVPARFYIQVEASDLAGNRGTAQTMPVILDRSMPRVSILNVQPNR
jgi:hypothetical protein